MTQATGNILTRVFLDGLTDRITTIINEASQGGKELEMEAGRQINLAIENTRNAYQESLELTVDKVDQVFKDNLDQLALMVSQVQTQNDTSLEKLGIEAQTFVNTLPLANLFPQVSKVMPQYIVSEGGGKVSITVLGNFPTAAQSPPTFSFGETQATLVHNTTKELCFSIDRSAFTHSNEKCTPSYGEIQFPKPTTTLIPNWLNPFAPAPFIYRVMIGSAPSSPGKLLLDWKDESYLPIKKWRTEDIHHQGAKQGRTYQLVATDGWKIVPGTERSNIRRMDDGKYVKLNGECRINISRANSTTAVYEVLSKYNVDFEMWFEETRQVKKEGEAKHKEIPLKWGEKTSINLPPSGRVLFIPFQGRNAELIGTRLSHPYVSILRGKSDIRVTTAQDII